MDNPPQVTVVIVNWNGKSLLRDCLDSLFEHTRHPSYRVVVVDNGSEDGSLAMLREEYPDVTVVANDSNRGFARANNQAFDRFPETEYYLLLNYDTEITDEGWLGRFVEVAERNGSGITGCRLVYPDGRLQHGGGIIKPGFTVGRNVKHGYSNKYGRDGSEEWSPDYVTGAAFLVHRDVIDDTGGFDEEFSPAFYEETDLCVRARGKGYDVVYTPEVEIVHREGGGSRESLPLCYFHNMFRFVVLHFPAWWLVLQAPFEVLRVLDHLYRRRSLRSIYGPIISELPSAIASRRSRDYETAVRGDH